MGKQGHYNLLWYDYIFSDLQFFSLCLVKFLPWKFSFSPPNSHVSFMCLPNKNILYQLSDPPKQPGVTYSCSEANNRNNPRNSKSRKKKRKITEVNFVCIKSLLSSQFILFYTPCRKQLLHVHYHNSGDIPQRQVRSQLNCFKGIPEAWKPLHNVFPNSCFSTSLFMCLLFLCTTRLY